MDEHAPDDFTPLDPADRPAEPGDDPFRPGGGAESFDRPPERDAPRPRRRRRPNRAFEQIAARLEDTADRLDHLVDLQLGHNLAGGRVSDAVQTTSEALQDVAEYFRSSDLRGIRDDLADQARARPLQTVLVALCAGWLAGKILR